MKEKNTPAYGLGILKQLFNLLPLRYRLSDAGKFQGHICTHSGAASKTLLAREALAQWTAES